VTQEELVEKIEGEISERAHALINESVLWDTFAAAQPGNFDRQEAVERFARANRWRVLRAEGGMVFYPEGTSTPPVAQSGMPPFERRKQKRRRDD
jgi:hypothetical protein